MLTLKATINYVATRNCLRMMRGKCFEPLKIVRVDGHASLYFNCV